jgi:hypothetical protein
VKINPQTFFNFCAAHTTLLRALAEHVGEVSQTDVLRLIRVNPALTDESPETTRRRLRELQILVPTEPGSELYSLADPIARLLTYLFNEANPATPEMIHGYVMSLETTSKRLARALDEEDVQQVRFSFEEIGQTLRRIKADLDETHHAILSEVARYKIERSRVSVREKYRRIVHWMERYVEPMIAIINAEGPMRAAFDETERLLMRARNEALFNDLPALARNQRILRLVASHALRVFTQCRKEIQPIYEALRRSTFIAEGAARALEKLHNEGLSKWGVEPLIGVYALRFQNVPGDAAIASVLRRLVEYPPEPPPVLAFPDKQEDPIGLRRLTWLDSLPQVVQPALPINDLFQWLIENSPNKDMSQVLTGFSTLIFHPMFQAHFTDADACVYLMNDGILDASPVQLFPA